MKTLDVAPLFKSAIPNCHQQSVRSSSTLSGWAQMQSCRNHSEPPRAIRSAQKHYLQKFEMRKALNAEVTIQEVLNEPWFMNEWQATAREGLRARLSCYGLSLPLDTLCASPPDEDTSCLNYETVCAGLCPRCSDSLCRTDMSSR